MKNFNKKGMDISMTTIITLIILVICFVVILFFWVSFSFESNIDKETCHTSVILRASASSSILKLEFREAVPLRCKTDNICLTSSLFGGECPSLGKTYDKVNVGGEKDKILEKIAQEIYDWHTTMGEGKVNFMPQGFSGKNYCFLNALVSFDSKTLEAMKKNNINIAYYDLYAKLGQMKTDKGTSYFEELFGPSANLGNLNQLSNLVIDTSQDYMIVTKISEYGKWKQQTLTAGVAAATAGGIIAFSVATAGTGPLIIAVISAIPLAAEGATVTGVTTHFLVAKDPNGNVYDYVAPALYPHNSEAVKALECDSFENRPASASS